MSRECQATAALVAWLRENPDVLFCGTIGGIHASVQAKVRAKREGYQRGIPDVMIYEPRDRYHGLAIEMKSRQGIVTAEQLLWHERLQRRGWVVCVCRSAEEAIRQATCYLSLSQSYSAAAGAPDQDDRTEPDIAASQ